MSALFQTTKNVFRRLFVQENSIRASILAALLIGLGVMTRGIAISPSNVGNILLQSATRGIASIGQTFVMLTAGIDLSIGGLALMGALFASKLMTERVDEQILTFTTPLSVTVLIAILVGLGVGAVNGSLIARLRIPAFIVTLGMWLIARSTALVISEGHTVLGVPRRFAFFGQSKLAGVPVPVIILIVAIVIAYYVLNHTKFGRNVYTVGGNPVSAFLSGINTKQVLLVVYMISGFLAVVAGLLILSRNMMGTNSMVYGLELDSIAACVVGGVSLFGGRGSLAGVVLGVMIIGVINNGLIILKIDPALQDLVKGGIIFAAVAANSFRRR
ncbi:ABC transporter permease [Chloroflexota bacterium]